MAKTKYKITKKRQGEQTNSNIFMYSNIKNSISFEQKRKRWRNREKKIPLKNWCPYGHESSFHNGKPSAKIAKMGKK
jgi:hypothetical protein